MADDRSKRAYLMARGWLPEGLTLEENDNPNSWWTSPGRVPGARLRGQRYLLQEAHEIQIKADLIVLVHLFQNLGAMTGVRGVLEVLVSELVVDYVKSLYKEMMKDKDGLMKSINTMFVDPEFRGVVRECYSAWKIYAKALDDEVRSSDR